MRLKNWIQQSHRYFTTVYQCEHCGAERTTSGGYDDAHFQQRVLLAMKCPECGGAALQERAEDRP